MDFIHSEKERNQLFLMITKNDSIRLGADFFQQDVLTVAPQLLGKTLVRKFDNQQISAYKITEVEAYRGTEDLACHASKGKTPRTQIMFESGGKVYVYLIYGIYWLLNIVVGKPNDASAILIREAGEISGPGRLGKKLQLDKSFYGEDLTTSERIWIEDAPIVKSYKSLPRVGIDYAGEPWVSNPWRFTL